MGKGFLDEAVDHFEEVLRMFPKHVSTHVHLAKIYMQRANWDVAREHLRIVLDVSPGHQEAIQLWQQLGS